MEQLQSSGILELVHYVTQQSVSTLTETVQSSGNEPSEFQKELEYQNTLLTINRVIDRIEQTDGYVVGETPVALVGTLQRSELSMTHEWFDKTSVGNSQNFAVTYYETYENYFERLLAYPIVLLEETESAKWAEHPTVQNMPSFPYQGSCEMVEGTLIVKLSE